MTLHIYNTLSRKKEPFSPIEAGKIKMYVCGITVYDYCHIGHARVLVAFDVITRYLRSQGWDVEYVRNITDIDEKILKRADENGEVFTDLTDRMIAAMHEDEDQLGVLRPDQEPRATGHMGDILAMIQKLVDNGYAYAADNGDVYYRVSRFADYGKLSRRNPEDLLAGARVDINEHKEDPRDFALWKSAAEGEVSWDSAWGKGRPGWHIECSAMSTCCLGNTFDIHGGGPDLPFPHHENEIAQSEAATGEKYVNTWMHVGAVRVDNEKMSKSLDNFFTIREVLKKYHPEVIRYFLLSSHYRSPINYSEDNLIEARSGLDRFYTALRPFAEVPAVSLDELKDSSTYQKFVESMNDDFNTPEALADMYQLVRELNTSAKLDRNKAALLAAELKGVASIFGILDANPDDWFKDSRRSVSSSLTMTTVSSASFEGHVVFSDEKIDALVDERTDAKENRDFARADQIRDELAEQGVILEDSREGTSWRRE